LARYRVVTGEPCASIAPTSKARPGQSDSILLRAANGFPLSVGDTLRHDRYDKGKKAIAEAAAARGYLDARFDSSQMRIDLEAYTCDVVLHMETGPRYLYGHVTLIQDIVDTLLLVGMIPFKEGDSLEVSGLRRLQANLSEATYFSQAQVELRREDADGLKIPIEVQLMPRKTQRYEFGLGYGTDTGVRGRVEVGFRRLNRRGHSAILRAEASQIERSLSAEYKVPPAYPRTALWTYGFGMGDFSPDWSSTRAIRLSVTPSRMVAGWRAALGLAYEIDAFEISVTEDTSSLLVLRTEWDHTRADDIRFPRYGAKIRLGLRGSHDAVLVGHSSRPAEARGIATLLIHARIDARSGGYTARPLRKTAAVRAFDRRFQTCVATITDSGSPDEYGAQVGGRRRW
jgi:translocation and assembly module TamA